MTYKLDSAIESLADALKSLKSDIIGNAIDVVVENEDYVQQVADRTLRLYLAGTVYPDEEAAPLSLLLQDSESTRNYIVTDPIAYAIEVMNDCEYTDWKAKLDRSINALQSGIDRLRAYEAERLRGAMK
jgi:predicted transcriptional regulator